MNSGRAEAPAHRRSCSAGASRRAGAAGASLLFVAGLSRRDRLSSRKSDLGVQSLVLVAAVFGILAISLDLVAGMLGLYSLGQGGFFAIGAYLTTIVVNDLGWNVFADAARRSRRQPVGAGLAVGAMSLRVSGLYFAITTFIFTLVLTVLATDLQDHRRHCKACSARLSRLPRESCVARRAGRLVRDARAAARAWRWSGTSGRSPLYPVLLSIRDAERFAEAAGVRTSLIKIGVFGLSAAMAGGAGWLFSFLGVVSPGQFDWAVSLNILVMVLVGGINTTLGPVIGAAFVSMFPALVNINPWLQEMVYGALSILAITLLPERRGGPGQTAPLAALTSAATRGAAGGCGSAQARRRRSRPASAELRRRTKRGESRGWRRDPHMRRMPRHRISATERAEGAAQRRSRGQARPYPRPYRPERVGQEHARQCHRRRACGRSPEPTLVKECGVDGVAAERARRAWACAAPFRRRNWCAN